MDSLPQNRNRVSAIFVCVVIASLLLFAVYLKVNPEFVRPTSHHIASHVKIWADPDQSITPKLKTAPQHAIAIILFSALFITPEISRPVGLVSTLEAAPPNSFFGLQRWSRPPPAF